MLIIVMLIIIISSEAAWNYSLVDIVEVQVVTALEKPEKVGNRES